MVVEKINFFPLKSSLCENRNARSATPFMLIAVSSKRDSGGFPTPCRKNLRIETSLKFSGKFSFVVLHGMSEKISV